MATPASTKTGVQPGVAVELNRVETDQRTPHQVQVFVHLAHNAEPNVLVLFVVVRHPTNLHLILQSRSAYIGKTN